MIKLFISFSFLLLVLFFSFTISQEPSEDNLNLASFDTVCQTVYENHFDSTFGGLDWRAINDRYRDEIAAVKTNSEFNEIVNNMLREIKLSHYVVFNAKEKSKSGPPIFAQGCIGLETRVLDGEAVVKSVQPSFPASNAGLKPGYTILSYDTISIKQIIERTREDKLDFYNDRVLESDINDAVAGHCYGEPGKVVTITYRNEENVTLTKELAMADRGEGVSLTEELPPFFIEFTHQRLENNIGYVYFNAFIPPVGEEFFKALDSMSDIEGLVIDIRGNGGGMHQIGEAIASRLVQEPTPFSVFKYRDSVITVDIEPEGNTFTGPVVILIDVLNASASERFSACMQSISRATIIGNQSPGLVGPSNLKSLPNGSSFMFLIARSLTPDGNVLEGTGVKPDIESDLSKSALLRGEDTQVDEAVHFINSQLEP